MINLSVDEAYAFDYLSILHVKSYHSEGAVRAWEKCHEFLGAQIDNQLWNSIIESEEYENLKKANQTVFNAVEKARYGNISAKEVDESNTERYRSKVKFQEKFFPKNKISETKT